MPSSDLANCADGKVGSLVDALGHFYKPMQVRVRTWRGKEDTPRTKQERWKAGAWPPRRSGKVERTSNVDAATAKDRILTRRAPQDEVRGAREVQFYETLRKMIGPRFQEGVEWASESNEGVDDELRSVMSALASVVPRYYGTYVLHGELGLKRKHIKLEDLTRKYENPSIVDIKVGFRTWYPEADEKYKMKCRAKDAATTSSTLGFKICGMQVYNAVKKKHWRADRNWCKQVSGESIHVALAAFGNNGSAATPEGIYLGRNGVLDQLRRIKDIFKIQEKFLFHSTSVLILYEGAAETVEDLRVTLKLVDFAHTFHADRTIDTNFLSGLTGLEQVIQGMFF